MRSTRKKGHRHRSKRPRALLRSGALSAVAVLALVAGLIDVGVQTAAPASAAPAASTAESDFAKVGTDLTHPSTASAASPGTALTGDTLQWVLNYQNKTNANASVSIN
ncbi:MAG: hypothetical protein ACTHON_08910, partial [Humibacter sp.]